MARPAKANALKSKHETKKEKNIKLAVENAFESSVEDAPSYLTEQQKTIYYWIYENLTAAQVSSRLDKVAITNAAMVIDMLNYYNEQMNITPSLRLDTKFTSAYQKTLSNFFKLCTELCLSPASRAKLGGLVAKQAEEEKDPLAAILGGGNSE